MLIGFFKSSYLVQYGMLLLLGVVLWLGSFLHPAAMPEPEFPLLVPGYQVLYNLLANTGLLNVLLAFLLTMSGSVLFNHAMAGYDLAPKNSLVPAMVFLILISSSKHLLLLNPIIIPLILMIITLIFLFGIYTKEEPYSEVFYVGFLVAFGSFFYFPVIFFFLLIFLTFFVFRIYFWREWIIAIGGFLTPYLFLWVYYFWIDSLRLAFDEYIDFFAGIAILKLDYNYSIPGFLIVSLIFLLFIWSFIRLAGDLNEKVISVRKRYWSVIWFFILSVSSFIFSGISYQFHQIFILMAASVFISYWLCELKRLKWVEIYMAVLILLILVNNLIW
ncbi:MAG: hypothetical protein JW731_05455 [Bacteroidales bacterium]|nr:hypothetical protein [Bacteroidales bacterium]